MLAPAMFDRILSFLTQGQSSKEAGTDTELATRRAAAGLMCYAAMLDGSMVDAERRAICRQLTERFGLDRSDQQTLIEAAEKEAQKATDLFGFTRDLSDALDEDGRVGVIEMLWEVVLADGTVTDLEANLIRRVSGLLYVSDPVSGLARQRVVERLAAKGS